MKSFTIKTETDITTDDIANMVITAFEGGISYWCDLAVPVKLAATNTGWEPIEGNEYERMKIDGCAPYANPVFWETENVGYKLHDEYDEDWVPVILTRDTILKALNHPLPGYEDSIRRLLAEEYDAADADVLVQSAIFNEVVYG